MTEPHLQTLVFELFMSEWCTSDNNTMVRYYKLTPRDRKQLSAATSKWEKTALGLPQEEEG